MKDEYDFSGAEQGKSYRPIEELDIPIYLDKEVKEFFIERLKGKGEKFSLNQLVNSLLKKDIEISNQLSDQNKAKGHQDGAGAAASAPAVGGRSASNRT